MIQIFLTILLSLSAQAVDIPKNLSQEHQIKALEVFGFGTSTKTVTFGYPLGGYPGLEIGMNIENIPTSDLKRLGSGSNADSLTYTKFSIAKGLYEDVDFFVQFIPLNEDKGISDYGGYLRWGFYEGAYFPLTLSAVLHGNNTNLNNVILAESIGYSVLGSVFMGDFTINVGLGLVSTDGQFIGCKKLQNPTDPNCTNQVTENGLTMRHTIHSLHSSMGFSYAMSKVFMAFQIDRYTQPVMSFKLGLRL